MSFLIYSQRMSMHGKKECIRVQTRRFRDKSAWSRVKYPQIPYNSPVTEQNSSLKY